MKENESITCRVEKLRGYMKKKKLDAFIIPSNDPHMSEYTPAHWQCRQWISGFNGSAGTAVVTLEKAALWTDSRYFLAAGQQLEGTPFTLMKDGLPDTPSIGTWLAETLSENAKAGIDGSLCTPAMLKMLESELSPRGISAELCEDPFNEVWNNRPELPTDKIEVHPLKYAGESAADKIHRLLGKARENGCDAMLLTALDEIAWTLNLRGNDVECNPVFVSYLLLSDRQNVLFVNPAKVSDEVREHLSLSGVETMPYTAVAGAVKNLHACRTMISNKSNCAIKSLFNDGECVIMPSIAEEMKAVKNSAEIAGFHSAMLRDGVAMVTFLSRLKSEVKKGITEMGVDRLLTSLRAEQELYRGLSFATIAAYGAHGAIVHYEADEHSDVKLEPHGFILIDSGAQYSDGTTDITRTISLGNPTEEEKKIYTLVLKGHIALSECVFPDGASGTQIDCAARYAMWQHFLNYGHGTGHGVGSYLNVHEGPHQIRMNYMPAPLRAGMTVTDEPGIYCEGKFGVRTENTLLIVPAGESQFGKFLKFEPLTLCPIDTAPIDLGLMTDKELQWLNDYHETVRQRLTPLIKDGAVKEWLADATKPISR
ncbi:MAG: aminopeptidase P family protein [Bacteroidaceae bacterium]|nr:aminopeptidase P family protein [Bacteroidaceae bacterium]